MCSESQTNAKLKAARHDRKMTTNVVLRLELEINLVPYSCTYVGWIECQLATGTNGDVEDCAKNGGRDCSKENGQREETHFATRQIRRDTRKKNVKS